MCIQAPSQKSDAELEVNGSTSFSGPFEVREITIEPRPALPAYIVPSDTRWALDPRVQKHKDDPRLAVPTTVVQDSPASPKSFDPRLVKTEASTVASIALEQLVKEEKLESTQQQGTTSLVQGGVAASSNQSSAMQGLTGLQGNGLLPLPGE